MYSDYYDGDDLLGSSHEQPCKHCWEGAQDCFCTREEEQIPTTSLKSICSLQEEGKEMGGRRKFLTDKMGYQPDDPGWN